MRNDEIASVSLEPGRLDQSKQRKEENGDNQRPIEHDPTHDPPHSHFYMLSRPCRPYVSHGRVFDRIGREDEESLSDTGNARVHRGIQ